MNLKEEIQWFKENVNDPQAHGKNILAKLRYFSRLKTRQQRELKEIVKKYQEWVRHNESSKGHSSDIIGQRVSLLNDYKNGIENANFTAQSKFHSSVLEEFLYYLFRAFLDEMNEGKEGRMLLGGTTAYSNLYFAPKNFVTFLEKPNMRINKKAQNFAIYRSILLKADNEQKQVNVPVASIECKTYIDKTMLEGSIATAEKIKNGNPYCLFLVVTEWYDVSFDVDPAYSRIDQIFVLRKQKRKDRRKVAIDSDVVSDLFNFVAEHLRRDWSNIEHKLAQEGKII